MISSCQREQLTSVRYVVILFQLERYGGYQVNRRLLSPILDRRRQFFIDG